MSKPVITRHSRHGRIKIRRPPKTNALVYVQRGGNQSAIDEHGVSLDAYIHALFGLTMQFDGYKVLMIGCAGGTLATMLHRAGRRVTAVDIDPSAFRIARAYFGLPRGVRCVCKDGLEFLRTTKARFDVVIVDAFIGEAVPKPLTGDEFCSAVRRVLKPRGAVLFNVCLDGYHDRAADDIGLRLKRHGWTVRLLDEPGPQRNAIIAAGPVRRLRLPRLIQKPALRGGQIKRAVSAMRFRRLKSSANLAVRHRSPPS